jgi:hypothetical protein
MNETPKLANLAANPWLRWGLTVAVILITGWLNKTPPSTIPAPPIPAPLAPQILVISPTTPLPATK